MKLKGNVRDFMRIDLPVVSGDATMQEVVSKMKQEDTDLFW
ncbi:MAG: hypothetical protein QXL78_06920 [Methanocellales archaeon]